MKDPSFSCLFLLTLLSSGNGNIFSTDLEPPHKNTTVAEKWEYYGSLLKQIVNATVKELLPYAVKFSAKLNIAPQCRKEILELVAGLQSLRTWAFNFIDSSGKSIDGLIYGSITAFGSYNECLDTVAIDDIGKGNGSTLFRGQYCSIDIKPALPPRLPLMKINEIIPELRYLTGKDNIISDLAEMASVFYFHPLRLGICVPSGCSKQDVDSIVGTLGEYVALNVTASKCDTEEDLSFTPLQIAVLFIFGCVGVFLLFGTLIDVYKYYSLNTKPHCVDVLLVFSLIKNFNKFTNTDCDSSTLKCLNGVRFLSMTWIVLSHSYVLVNFRMYLDLKNLEHHGKDLAFQVVANGSLSVETFFIMAGLLVSYLAVRLVKLQNYPFDVKLVMIRRLWRIIPIYSFVILFSFLSPLMGSGPMWENDFMSRNCDENWWTNLLFINNFHLSEKMCLPHSWYLSADFQLFIIGMFVVYILLKSPRLGLFFASILVVAFTVYVAIVVYIYDLPPTSVILSPEESDNLEFWQKMYFHPFPHGPPYFIGFMAGYLLATKPNLKIPYIVQVIGWILAFAMNIAVVYGTFPWNAGRDPTFWEQILYPSLNRSAWALGVVWVIVCCCTGHGGIVNYILSWKIFIPLSRLTFLMYLLHPFVIISFSRSIRTQVQMDYSVIVWNFFGNLIASYSIAFAASMMLEAPMMAIEKLVFKKKMERTSQHVFSITKSFALQGINDKQNGLKDTNLFREGHDNLTCVYKF